MLSKILLLTGCTFTLMVLFSPSAQANGSAGLTQLFGTRPEAGGLTFVSEDEGETEQDIEERKKEELAEAHREICYPPSWPVISGPVAKGSKLELCQIGGTGPWYAFITPPDGIRTTAPDGEYKAASYVGTITVFAGVTCTTTAPCGVTPPHIHSYLVYPDARSR